MKDVNIVMKSGTRWKQMQRSGLKVVPGEMEKGCNKGKHLSSGELADLTAPSFFLHLPRCPICW